MKGKTKYQELKEVKAVSLTTTLQDMLSQAEGKGDSDLVAILKRQILAAKRGDLRAAEFILNRAFGTPVQQVNQNIDKNVRYHMTIEVVPAAPTIHLNGNGKDH